MDHVHMKTKFMSRSNSSKMACEKASRKLKATLLKATRLGVTTAEVAGLPAAKKLIPQRDHGWRLAVFMVLMFGGGVVVALVCMAKHGCSRIDDITIVFKLCIEKNTDTGDLAFHQHSLRRPFQNTGSDVKNQRQETSRTKPQSVLLS